MKKTLLLFGAFLLSLNVAFSQTAFFTEDFASGIPAGWSNSGTDANGTTVNNMWKYTTTGNKNYSYNPTVKLNSPTKANGWILFDSDSLDASAGIAGGQRGYLTTTPINCTGHPQVIIEWYQYFRGYDANIRLIVGNGTLTDTLEAAPDYMFNFAETPNAQKKQFDITAIAGNQANVTITVLWDKTTSGYYDWQVDDISLIDAPANDLWLTTAHSFNYYSYPYSELDSIGYYGFVTNIGTTPQPNTRVSLTVKKAASVVFTDTSALGLTMPYGIDSPILGSNSFLLPATAASKGTYTAYENVFSDSVGQPPFQNADTSQFAVSDSVFAVENGQYGGSFVTFLPANLSNSGQSASQEWASIFYLPNADTITSVTVGIDGIFTYTGPTTGGTIQANIYSLPDVLTSPSTSFTANRVLNTEIKQLTNANTTAFTNAVNMKIDVRSGGIAGGYATVLQPGFYAVSLVSPSGDSLVSVVNGFAGKGLFGLPGGLIDGGSLTAYSNTRFILRPNFGHGLNTLFCDFTRTPPSTPLHPGQIITYTGTSNGSVTTVYNWTVTGLTSGDYKTGVGKIWKDTLRVADDSMQVCLTVTDGSNTATTCKIIRVRESIAGVNEVSSLSSTRLSPNPTTGNVTISTDNVTGALSISITNLLGETVKTFNENAGGSFSKSYNLSDLSSGIYIVKLQNGDNSTTKRLSISK